MLVMASARIIDLIYWLGANISPQPESLKIIISKNEKYLGFQAKKKSYSIRFFGISIRNRWFGKIRNF